jgi:hypothetical protein
MGSSYAYKLYLPLVIAWINGTRKRNSMLAGHWSSFKLHAHLRKEESTAYGLTPFGL